MVSQLVQIKLKMMIEMLCMDTFFSMQTIMLILEVVDQLGVGCRSIGPVAYPDPVEWRNGLGLASATVNLAGAPAV